MGREWRSKLLWWEDQGMAVLETGLYPLTLWLGLQLLQSLSATQCWLVG